MDGFEVCRRLKQDVSTQNIPVMFLSGSGGLRERVEGFRAGSVDYVMKPFQRDELLARVRTHIELGMLRSHLEQAVAKRTSELLESEERFRTMADAAPVMIWASDSNKLCSFVNKEWREFTGRKANEDLGDGWSSAVHPEDLEYCYQTYSSSFDARQSFEMECRLRRKDGEYRWVLDKGIPRFLSNGTFTGYIGSCLDITDLKQNHNRLLAAQKLESLAVMAAGVAHDFGNLLGTIFGESDVALSDMQPDSPGRENVERIQGLATYASDIVRLLRDSAGGSIDSKTTEPVNLSFLAEQTIRLVSVSISKRATIRTSLPKDLPSVLGNATQLRQVVINLVTNAAEALGNKEGIITVTTEAVSSGHGSAAKVQTQLRVGESVRLTVSDTGCGMNAQTRAKIFDQFFTTKSSGRGLGLAAVHGIVRSHGGIINVTSNPGLGATFEVLFPCAHRAQQHDALRNGSLNTERRQISPRVSETPAKSA
jgi:PAS domain S-box-containing protein